METELTKYPGVGLDIRRKKHNWYARIKVNQKTIFLGMFDTFEDAINKKKEAESIYHTPLKKERDNFEKRVIEFYNDNHTLEQTGKQFDRHSTSILGILQKNNIKTRTNEKQLNEFVIIDLYKKGNTIQNISTKLNVSFSSIRSRLVKNGLTIKPNRKYFFNESIFEKIDCEWKAYYLGLFYADGGVGKLNIKLSLIESDRILIDTLNNIVYDGKYELDYIPAKTWFSLKTKKFYTSHPQIGILLNSKKVVSDIKKLGCGERKSLTLQFPSVNIIPHELFHHFIRGYFDGDGWISKHTFGIISSDDFCFGFQKFLFTELNINSYMKKAGKVSRILVHKQKDKQILKEYIYKNATIFLKRKYNNF